MRVRLLSVLPCLVFGVLSHAQSAGIGIKGGILASTAKALLVRTQPISGGTAGLYFPWNLSPMMELQPEILISTLGTAWVEPDGDTYTERSLYLQIPLTVKIFLSNGFNLAGGYQFAKPLAAQVKGAEGVVQTLERYKDLDMGFVGGFGMDLDHGLDLSLRGYSAMTRFHGNDDAVFAKNRSIQLTVGYRVHQFRCAIPTRRR